MKYLIIDTETTGLFDFKLPADAPGQPRMAQFGGIYLDDIEGEPVKRSAHYVSPDGWTMPEEASKVNGLTTKFLIDHGTPVEWVLSEYADAIRNGYVIVAFNTQFDTKVLRAELRRAGMDDLFDRTPNICVMRPLTDIIQIPRRSGAGFKFPNLAEALAYFEITNSKAHDAMGDAEAALAIMRRLHTLALLPEPKVHFAKETA